MKGLFADTSFFIALVNPRDELHGVAREIARAWKQGVVTTDFVLLEAANWLSRTGDRLLFVDLYGRLRIDSRTTIIPADRPLFVRGCAVYGDRGDKNWSLTDCISFIVMEELGLSRALTADRHFEQAGFEALLLRK
ncbi:MAG: type II toxin-antitoxin system VapC family toxin [Planctomycetes bacterium]|nr:type II toxin-antitoxin system VapC family toxin [Planctomycetota bacterium]